MSAENIYTDPNDETAASVTHDVVALGLASRAYEEWLAAFRASKGREPDQNEVEAFLIGEQTSLRREAYDFIADATLGGVFGSRNSAMPRHLYLVRKERKKRRARAPGFFAHWFGAQSAESVAPETANGWP